MDRRGVRWCFAGAWIVVVGVAFAPAIVTGCGGDPCVSACENNNRLGCAGTCDCTACAQAPSTCHTFFACIASQSTCTDMFLNCTEPQECATYISAHCK